MIITDVEVRIWKEQHGTCQKYGPSIYLDRNKKTTKNFGQESQDLNQVTPECVTATPTSFV
jgi:hypothetical protein